MYSHSKLPKEPTERGTSNIKQFSHRMKRILKRKRRSDNHVLHTTQLPSSNQDNQFVAECEPAVNNTSTHNIKHTSSRKLVSGPTVALRRLTFSSLRGRRRNSSLEVLGVHMEAKSLHGAKSLEPNSHNSSVHGACDSPLQPGHRGHQCTSVLTYDDLGTRDPGLRVFAGNDVSDLTSKYRFSQYFSSNVSDASLGRSISSIMSSRQSHSSHLSRSSYVPHSNLPDAHSTSNHAGSNRSSFSMDSHGHSALSSLWKHNNSVPRDLTEVERRLSQQLPGDTSPGSSPRISSYVPTPSISDRSSVKLDSWSLKDDRSH